MNRRSFFGKLGSLFGALFVGAFALKSKDSHVDSIVKNPIGYKGTELLKFKYVYLPYMPLYQTELLYDNSLKSSKMIKDEKYKYKIYNCENKSTRS